MRIMVVPCSLLLSSQVETVAQFGVVFLLFALGLEFSLTKVNYRKIIYDNIFLLCLEKLF